MPTHVALLRAVNVGGTGALKMADLKALCAEAGAENVRTVLASGNAIFESTKTPAAIKKALEAALNDHVGKPVGVVIRTAAEIEAVLRDNPFPDADPRRSVAIFLDKPPPHDFLEKLKGQKDEEVEAGTREIYVHYPSGIGKSKLKIAAAENGTARNMSTIAKVVLVATSA